MAALDGTITMTSSEYRPCEVGGKKALFHRWAEINKAMVKVKPFVSDRDIQDIKNSLRDGQIGLFDSKVDVTPIMQTIAIVEYEDGTVAEVAPVQVHFLDSARLFNSIAFGGSENA